MKQRPISLGLLVFFLFAAVAGGQDAKKKPETKKNETGTRIACIGDSITYGAGIKERAKNSYPSQLAQLLGDAATVKNFGVSGATLLKNGDRPYWKTGQYRNAIDWNPQVVVIKLGTNDTKPQNWKHKDQFAADLKAMVTSYRSQPSKPEIFLCLPVPAFPERWGIRDSVIKDELIPIIRKVAKEEKCQVIDLYKALDGKKSFFPDKVHPNKDGAEVIAKTVHAALEKKVKVKKPKASAGIVKERKKPAAAGPPFAAAVPGKYGLVFSPFVANQARGLVNVTDASGAMLPSGTEVSCPHTGKIFRVP